MIDSFHTLVVTELLKALHKLPIIINSYYDKKSCFMTHYQKWNSLTELKPNIN